MMGCIFKGVPALLTTFMENEEAINDIYATVNYIKRKKEMKYVREKLIELGEDVGEVDIYITTHAAKELWPTKNYRS